ncbi:MAG: DUF1801 domain-containing protein, partial [Bacteroidota bacterium]
MAKYSPSEYRAKVDEFMEKKTLEFSKPICERLRKLLLDSGLEEEYKWQMPVYSHHGIVCSIGAFKKHVGLWFMKGALLKDNKKVLIKGQATTKALRSIQFKSIDDLDEKLLRNYIQEAMILNEQGISYDFKQEREDLIIPKEFEKRMKANKKAWDHYQNFSYSKQRDYIEWISTAKREETKEKRMNQAIEMLEK